MRRYLRLYAAFWQNCLRQAVEYRVNFWANTLTSLGWLAGLVLLLKLIFRNTQSVAGWSEPAMLLLIGTYSLVRGIGDLLFSKNLSELPQQIRQGTMDFTLLKPVDSQFFVSLRFISLDSLGQLAGSIPIIALGLAAGHFTVHLANACVYAGLVVCGVLIVYALSVIAMSLSFWLVRLDNLFVALEMLFSVGRTPLDVFRAWGSAAPFLLTYVVPVAFLASVPARALFAPNGEQAALIAAPILTALFLAASALVWRAATRAYASASS